MAIVGERKSVSNSPTLIVQGTDQLGNARPTLVRNLDTAASVDLGGPAVVSGSGFPLNAGETAGFQLMIGDDLYGITSSGSVVVAVCRGRS